VEENLEEVAVLELVADPVMVLELEDVAVVVRVDVIVLEFVVDEVVVFEDVDVRVVVEDPVDVLDVDEVFVEVELPVLVKEERAEGEGFRLGLAL
jgi:hypothetical protein